MSHFVRILLFSGLLSMSSALHAQAGFFLPTVNEAVPNTVVTVPVSVLNFDSIVSAQFVVSWDPAVLDYLAVVSFNMEDLSSEKFGETEVDSGFLRVVWWHTGNGLSVADSTPIFKIKFKVIGTDSTLSPLQITQLPPNTFYEVADAYGNFFDLESSLIYNGSVAVGFVLDASEPFQLDALQAYVAPNPISSQSKLFLESDEAINLRYSIVNASGQSLFFEKISLPPGKHGMEIATPLLRQRGPHYLVLQTPKTTRVIPLLIF
ncbi:MAG: cohesin domain-containing protein [Saprospiraceae bacterium]|jgi:hypothetical protein